MGFRLFRRIKILPGVTLNLSKSGVSESVGVRGAHVTVSSKGVRKTVGLPGSGVFYTEYRKHGGKPMPTTGYSINDRLQTGNNNMMIMVIFAVIGLAIWLVFGIGNLIMVSIVTAVIYFAFNRGAADANSKTPDPREGLDKRFFTASGDAKYSESEAALIAESAKALVTLVSTSLTVANESTDFRIRVSNTKNAKDAIATLQKYIEAYPGILLTNFDEVMHSVELIEQETLGVCRAFGIDPNISIARQTDITN